MEISQVNKENASQQMLAYSKQAQHVIMPASGPDNMTVTVQSNQLSEKTGDQVQLKYLAAPQKLHIINVIENRYGRLNQLVGGVKQTNEALYLASQTLSKMQSEIQPVVETIVKNYSPVSMESAERQKTLMSYYSLRQEIVKLMFPAPPSPVYEKVKHMWDDLFDDMGQLSQTAVPLLEKMSTDRQVVSAAAKINNTGEHISNLSRAITNALSQC